MKILRLFVASALLSASGPVLAAPVTVTHFIAADASLSVPAHGTVTVTTAPGDDAQSLELRPWIEAVTHEVDTLGFGAATPNSADFLIEVHLDRQTTQGEKRRGPVSVGVGGESGSRYSGFGLGLGFSFGGGPRATTATRLVVTIRDRASRRPLWEGRADSVESAKSDRAQPDKAAPRLAHAVFAGFPGKSGETITVR